MYDLEVQINSLGYKNEHCRRRLEESGEKVLWLTRNNTSLPIQSMKSEKELDEASRAIVDCKVESVSVDEIEMTETETEGESCWKRFLPF